jgi:hypothetical protein
MPGCACTASMPAMFMDKWVQPESSPSHMIQSNTVSGRNVLCKKRSISCSTISCGVLTAVQLLISSCWDGLFSCLHTGSCGEIESSAVIFDLVVEMVVASATASTAASLHAVPLSSPNCASMVRYTSKSRDCVDDLPCPIRKRSIPERCVRRKCKLYDAVLVSAREPKGECERGERLAELSTHLHFTPYNRFKPSTHIK